MVMTRMSVYKGITWLRPRAHVHPLGFLTQCITWVEYRGLTGEPDRSVQLVELAI